VRTTRLPRWLLAGLAGSVALVIMASVALAWVNTLGHSSDVRYGSMPAFHLTDQGGRPIADTDFKGTFTVVGFIYTSCPDVCPLLTSRMALLQAKLGEQGLLGSQVRLLSISVDPEHDTPAVLSAYAKEHGADTATWSFVTGDLSQIRSVVTDGFKVGYEKVTPHADHDGHGGDPYEVSHSGQIALVDPSGAIRAYYDGEQLDPDQVIADIQKLK
jgi:protein SCO1/2